MKRILPFLLIFSLLFCACGEVSETSSVETPFPVTVGEITLLEKPERVVSLSPFITQTLISLDLSDTLVGVSDFCVHPSALKMGTAESPDIEAIVKAEPDFVLISQQMSEEGREYLSKNNIPFYIIEKPRTFNALTGLFCDLITVFEGKTDGLLRGQSLSANIIARANAMKEIVALEENKTYLYVQPDGFYLTGETLISDILKTIGFENVAEEYVDYLIDDDTLKQLEPSIIFVDKSVNIEQFSKTKPFNKMTDNIISLDMAEISRLSPRVLDAFLDLVGGEEAFTSSEETSSEIVSSEVTE